MTRAVHRRGLRCLPVPLCATRHTLVAVVLAVATAGTLIACDARTAGPEAQSPALVFPAHFAEGEPVEAGAPLDAGTSAHGTARRSHAPDPEPLRLDAQWEYELRHVDGRVTVARVTSRRLAAPAVTVRRTGRWALELWIGRELVDRVRFDFPLLAAETPREGSRRPLHEPATFAPGLDATVVVLVPASPRATRLELVDRATGAVERLPWPPDDPIVNRPADAGAPLTTADSSTDSR